MARRVRRAERGGDAGGHGALPRDLSYGQILFGETGQKRIQNRITPGHLAAGAADFLGSAHATDPTIAEICEKFDFIA